MSGIPKTSEHDSGGAGEIQPRWSGMMADMDAYIALGSNLGDRGAHLRSGLERLEQSEIRPVAVSSVWETEPVAAPGPGWFWNMAIRAETRLPALALLDRLLEIERSRGRRRSVRNGPRTLDLDLLMLGELRLDHVRLALPHPRMWRRRFVLEPLSEIAPELRNPATGRTAAEESDCLAERVRRIGLLPRG